MRQLTDFFSNAITFGIWSLVFGLWSLVLKMYDFITNLCCRPIRQDHFEKGINIYINYIYNMEISIYGYNIDLYIIILIGIGLLILSGFTLKGCCSGIREEFGIPSINCEMMPSIPKSIKSALQPVKYVWQHPLKSIKSISPCADKTKESFSVDSVPYNLTSDQPMSTPASQLPIKTPPQTKNSEDMLIFANTSFKPECCSNSSYSNSLGCACITDEISTFLQTRGTNNVPFSKY